MHALETIINKVAESGIVTINLEQFLPNNVAVFDVKPFLFMGLIIKEKEFRANLLQHQWEQYEHKNVVITCTADAIIPVWAHMLISQYLQPIANHVNVGSEEEYKKQLLLSNINNLNTADYTDKRVVIKGCGETPIPESAYALITFKLKPVVKSIMYGEPCSTVPIYKRK